MLLLGSGIIIDGSWERFSFCREAVKRHVDPVGFQGSQFVFFTFKQDVSLQRCLVGLFEIQGQIWEDSMKYVFHSTHMRFGGHDNKRRRAEIDYPLAGD